MERVCFRMWSFCMGRICFGIWGFDIVLGSVVIGSKESDRFVLGFGGFNGDRFCFEIWGFDIGRVWFRIWGFGVY